MNSELNILNKHFKKMFPFVIEVDGFTLERNKTLYIDIFISPIHYCELINNEVDRLINRYMIAKSSDLIKSVLPEWNGDIVQFRFFPEVNELTVFNGLDYKGM
jgi:hypothetical protein